jgi:hypothetical protein
MREPIKDPPIFCQRCGREIERTRLPCGQLTDRTVFLRRKFCSNSCAKRSRPTKAEPQHSESHRRARAAKPLGACERCGEQGRDIHHKDGNWLNNEIGNLECLCRPCHTKHHRGHA